VLIAAVTEASVDQALTTQAAMVPTQASSDAHLIELWLHGRPDSIRRAYAGDVAAFLAHVGKSLRQVTLGDVQTFVDSRAAWPPRREVGRSASSKAC
jgi:integrase/recombinase XerD